MGSQPILAPGALAGAGDAAADVRAPGAAANARSYYRELVGDTATWPGSEATVSDYERAALNAYAAGIDPGACQQPRT